MVDLPGLTSLRLGREAFKGEEETNSVLIMKSERNGVDLTTRAALAVHA